MWLRTNRNIENTGWRHVATLYDGKEYRVYVDGIVMGRLVGSPPRTDGQQTLLFGAEADVGNPKGRYWFHGAIDDIQIYNRALSDAELRSLYD